AGTAQAVHQGGRSEREPPQWTGSAGRGRCRAWHPPSGRRDRRDRFVQTFRFWTFLKELPRLAELPSQLTDPAWTQAEVPGQVEGPVPQSHLLGDAVVPVRQGEQPGREVHAEDDLLGDRGLGVAEQRLLPRRPALGAAVRQLFDAKAAAKSGSR